ncbi:MAG: PAS domain S-box protein, partial [Nitrosomonadales bacterium]|nr:PAS domain S-box protein [Nitrosomonadales bacterium]
ARLAMLEDLENARRKVEQAHIEWMAALDVVNDPIFLHDKQFHILRCNKAYQQRAGIPFHELIGQPYYEVFPKTGAPLPCCLRAMEKAEEEEEEVLAGDAIYRSRAFSVHDEQGAHLYSVHTLEDITERRRIELTLHESEEKFRKISESAQDAIIMMADKHISFWNAAAERIFGYTAAEVVGQELHALIVPEPAHARFEQAFPHFQASGEGPIIGKVIEVTALRKGGEEFPAELSISATQFGGQWHAIGIVRDITRRKRAEEELRLRAQLLDSTNDSIFVHDFDGKFVYLNEAAWKMRGYTRGELMGMNLQVLDTPEYGKLVEARSRELMEKGHCIFESAHRRKDGSVMPIEVSARIIETDGRKLVLAAARDITERNRAEDTLRESEERFHHLFENMSSGVAVYQPDAACEAFTFKSVNKAAERIDQVRREDIVGRNVEEVFPGVRAFGVLEVFQRVCRSGSPEHFPAAFYQDEHISGWRDNYVYRLKSGEIVAVYDDVTERKQAEQTLRESEKLYRSLFENMLNGFAYCRMIFEQDQPQDFIYLSVNPAYERLTGRKNVVGKRVSEVIPGIRQTDPGIFEIYGRVSLSGKPEQFEIYVEATQSWYSISAYSPEKGYFVVVFDIITERKKAEAAIEHANRALAALSAVNRTLVRAASEDELLQSICQAIVQQRAYLLAWVGYKQYDENKSIRVMARAGHDEGYLDTMRLTWAETERGMGPSGRAIRSGVTQLCQDMVNDPSYLLWRDAASQRGYASDIALPLIGKSGDVFGILHVYSGETNTFTPAEIALLEEMAGDLAFGVHTLHTRRERDLALVKNQEQLVQLQDSLEDTVRAIATIVEMRDPYTAGHQVRVADLATAIAKQMGMPEEQAHAIHLAGVVHDLGKINVPAEILSKPGKITDLEFGLIKIHPQAGYDILKGIDFPWPIAQMVWQHHERLDGSGYPQGLKGEAILPGARILAVADVVEAMYSHRPYRPGLGIEVALAEITKQRGIYFDTQVVDACLALFREQGYRFK